MVPPTQDNQAVLDEGVLAYPRDHDLLYKNAALQARFAYVDEARSLIAAGLKVVHDEASRARFEKLLASLPAPAEPVH